MPYDVIVICSCLKTHDYFIFISSFGYFLYVIHRSLAMATEPSDIGGINELINKLNCD